MNPSTRRNILTFPASKIPTIADIAWAAGFYEGEGCCYTIKYETKKRPGTNFYEVITVRQVNEEPLERLKKLFGGTVKGPYSQQGLGRQPIYSWATSGARARGILLTLFPFLSKQKKAQIEKLPFLQRAA